MMMLRIATLLSNFRNPTNTSNPASLQANLLLVGVWRVKPPDSILYVNIHCYLLLTLASNSLSCVLTMAYFTAPGYYNIIREMPAGKGFADFAFIPRANAGFRPAMVVELKYNKSADTAIKQIKDNRYHGALSGYSDKILLVGISYDAEGKDKKHHTCVIEEINGSAADTH